jgi:8-hydroxy-5-deazaflavin:NADPH oxidoreductase
MIRLLQSAGKKSLEGACFFYKSNRARRWVMKIGFIGAGNVTRTFGRHLIAAGHTIVVSNSRGPANLADFVADLGPGAIAGTREQAAECDVVILAAHWVNVPEALKGIDWRGRILIDATNAHMNPKPDISLAGVTRSRAALKGRTSSEMVAEMAVGARLVQSISNMPMAWIQDFSPNKPRTVIFTSDDDTEAKQLVVELVNSTGLVAIDLGSLTIGGAMHEVGAPLSGLDLHFVRRLR